MLEIGIFCVILLAAGYWAAMYVMVRHDDVIHGKFVHSQDVGEFAQAMAPPPFPKRPVRTVQVANELPPAGAAAAIPARRDPAGPAERRLNRAALEPFPFRWNRNGAL